MIKEYMNWSEFDKLTQKIYSEIGESNIKYDGIIGIARGGLFLSGYLSYKMGIKNFYVINTKAYENMKRIEPKIIYGLEEIRFNNVLVVDDILDSGTTYHFVNKFLEKKTRNRSWAVLIDKGKSDIKIDYVGKHIKSDSWIEFPWNVP